jgi:hypothetical protein
MLTVPGWFRLGPWDWFGLTSVRAVAVKELAFGMRLRHVGMPGVSALAERRIHHH